MSTGQHDQHVTFSDIALRTFKFKLSPRSPRDVQLAEWMKADLEQREVNLSDVVKGLLFLWYKLRATLGYIPAPEDLLNMAVTPQGSLYNKDHFEEPEEGIADPNDPLTRKLLGLRESFEEM